MSRSYLTDSENEFNELQDEYMSVGDARRCPIHPNVKISSSDGMFDAPCGQCEYEMSQEEEKWDHSPENPKRPYCGIGSYISLPRNDASCVPSEEDNIPF